MSRWPRLLAAVAFAAAACGASAAPPRHTVVAVPFYTPADAVAGAYRHWYVPRAAEFVRAATQLDTGLRQFCAAESAAAGQLPAVRERWHHAALAWERLAAVAVGPLVQRRSARRIDFAPARPKLIARGIAQAPDSVADLQRVGTPGKGLPALEWLLWTRPVAPATTECHYAALLAQEIVAEAAALSEAFAALAARDWHADEAAATGAMGELLNQWVGALERLRWARMEKPQRSAGSQGQGEPPEFDRAAANATATSWRAQWQGIQRLVVAQAEVAPVPGADVVPLESYLRGRGLNPLADRLAQATAAGARAIEAARPADAASVLHAAQALAALKRLAEAEVAPALEVQIGFSDSDGD